MKKYSKTILSVAILFFILLNLFSQARAQDLFKQGLDFGFQIQAFDASAFQTVDRKCQAQSDLLEQEQKKELECQPNTLPFRLHRATASVVSHLKRKFLPYRSSELDDKRFACLMDGFLDFLTTSCGKEDFLSNKGTKRFNELRKFFQLTGAFVQSKNNKQSYIKKDQWKKSQDACDPYRSDTRPEVLIAALLSTDFTEPTFHQSVLYRDLIFDPEIQKVLNHFVRPTPPEYSRIKTEFTGVAPATEGDYNEMVRMIESLTYVQKRSPKLNETRASIQGKLATWKDCADKGGMNHDCKPGFTPEEVWMVDHDYDNFNRFIKDKVRESSLPDSIQQEVSAHFEPIDQSYRTLVSKVTEKWRTGDILFTDGKSNFKYTGRPVVRGERAWWQKLLTRSDKQHAALVTAPDLGHSEPMIYEMQNTPLITQATLGEAYNYSGYRLDFTKIASKELLRQIDAAPTHDIFPSVGSGKMVPKTTKEKLERIIENWNDEYHEKILDEVNNNKYALINTEKAMKASVKLFDFFKRTPKQNLQDQFSKARQTTTEAPEKTTLFALTTEIKSVETERFNIRNNIEDLKKEKERKQLSFARQKESRKRFPASSGEVEEQSDRIDRLVLEKYERLIEKEQKSLSHQDERVKDLVSQMENVIGSIKEKVGDDAKQLLILEATTRDVREEICSQFAAVGMNDYVQHIDRKLKERFQMKGTDPVIQLPFKKGDDLRYMNPGALDEILQRWKKKGIVEEITRPDGYFTDSK